MSIFSRIGEIINANISGMLDKAEDPQKMIRLMIHEMEDTLTEVKSSAAEVIAERIRTERRLKQIRQHIEDWTDKAELAVSKERDDLARIAIERKLGYAADEKQVVVMLAEADEMVLRYQEDIARLESKLSNALARQKELIRKAKRAANSRKLEERIYKANTHVSHKFDMVAERIDRMEAESEVAQMSEKERDIEKEFRDLENEGQIDRELAELKKQKTTKS